MKNEIINRLKAEGKEIRINGAELIATAWTKDSKKNQYYSECFELVGGRWEGFVAIKRGK